MLNLCIDVGKSTAIVSRAARAPHNEAAMIPEFVVCNGYSEAAEASRRAGKQIRKGCKPSALARNDPTLLTKPDPGNPPAAGMISLSLPSTCGQRGGRVRWVTLSEQKWLILAERRGD